VALMSQFRPMAAARYRDARGLIQQEGDGLLGQVPGKSFGHEGCGRAGPAGPFPAGG
jgi:hypothetical protein